jgi:hypothetical protein
MLAGCAVALLAIGAAAAVAVAQTPTLSFSVPAVFKTKFIKSGPNKGLAKKAFKWSVTATDSNPGAVLDVFVRPTLTPCAPTAGQEGTTPQAGGNGGQSLIPRPGEAEPSVQGTATLTRKLQPVRGSSRLCGYLHTGDPSHKPDATATATFVAKKKR